MNLFDSQHMHLEVLTALLDKKVKEESSQFEIEVIFDNIVHQLQGHFNSEDEMMKILDYKEINKHSNEHRELISLLCKYEFEFKNNTLDMSLVDLIRLVSTRIETHIKKLDTILSNYHIEHYNFSNNLTESNELSVHVSIFDTQHQTIYFLLNLLKSAIMEDEDLSYISRLLFDFMDKLKVHFQHEEKLMRRYNFPLYSEHYNDHQEFLKLANEIKHHIERNTLNVSHSDIVEILENRVNDHIIKQDQQYSEFFNSLR